jgi:hypothetical protein
MEPAFKALLVDRNGVAPETVNWLQDKGCLTVANFANWVDSRAEIASKIHDKTPKKDDAADLSRLKQAWREADASITRGVKRTAEGLDAEGIDDPLQEQVFKAIIKSFRTFYSWPDNIDSRRIGCDSLHGRFRREFERRQPGMFPFLKAKSLAKSQRDGQVKKTKLSEGIELVQAVARDVGDGPSSLSKWFTGFDIVVNTWAVTGCFDVQFGGHTKKYMHWADGIAYMFEFQSKANELRDRNIGDKQIFSYLSSVEEEMRSKAVEIARSESEVPWGESLKKAIKDYAHIWQEKRDIVEPRVKAPQPLWSMSPQAAGGNDKVCHHFNRPGGCQRVDCSYKHACDAILLSGGRCGRTDHGKDNHNDVKHGKTNGKGLGKGRGRGKGKK